MLLLLAAAHASPQTVHVSYTVRWDVDATGDRICSFTKLCDCTSTYVGEGTLKERTAERLTFEGTWARTANDCSDPLTVWTPGGVGRAFHTVRLSDGRVDAWVVHGEPTRHEPLKTDIKQGGQFWMDELGSSWPTAHLVSDQTDGTSLAGGIRIDARHHLELRFSAE